MLPSVRRPRSATPAGTPPPPKRRHRSRCSTTAEALCRQSSRDPGAMLTMLLQLLQIQSAAVQVPAACSGKFGPPPSPPPC